MLINNHAWYESVDSSSWFRIDAEIPAKALPCLILGLLHWGAEQLSAPALARIREDE